MPINTILNEDCLSALPRIESNSVDLIVTDPPYGYSFMGKEWDKAVPSVDIWKECLRVLKPGGFAFIMSAPRQDVLSRMMINLESAGFDTDFSSIYWTYAVGFPKASNMSKLIDKRLGVDRTVVGTKKQHDIRNNSLLEANQPDIKKENQMFDYQITVATSEEAKKFEGAYAGYQPKPAVEIAIVAMKPFDNEVELDREHLDKLFAENFKCLPDEIQRTYPYMVISKASQTEKNMGCSGEKNIHPTVKPIKLMAYLIALASKEDETILDPFCGSGTTCIAARLLNRKYIGIELTPEYHNIAVRRVSISKDTNRLNLGVKLRINKFIEPYVVAGKLQKADTNSSFKYKQVSKKVFNKFLKQVS